jgi:hypothetical protein
MMTKMVRKSWFLITIISVTTVTFVDGFCPSTGNHFQKGLELPKVQGMFSKANSAQMHGSSQKREIAKTVQIVSIFGRNSKPQASPQVFISVPHQFRCRFK